MVVQPEVKAPQGHFPVILLFFGNYFRSHLPLPGRLLPTCGNSKTIYILFHFGSFARGIYPQQIKFV